MGFEPTHHCRRQWGKQASRGSGNTSQGGRTCSRGILRCYKFLTSVNGPLSSRERGCLGSGGNRPE